jgi:hypothetical protein
MNYEVNTSGAPVFAPDYSAAVLAGKMYIRFLWFVDILFK